MTDFIRMAQSDVYVFECMIIILFTLRLENRIKLMDQEYKIKVSQSFDEGLMEEMDTSFKASPEDKNKMKLSLIGKNHSKQTN